MRIDRCVFHLGNFLCLDGFIVGAAGCRHGLGAADECFNVASGLAFLELTDQRGNAGIDLVHQGKHVVGGSNGLVNHTIQEVFNRPRQFANTGGANQSAAPLERVEGTTNLGQRFTVIVVLAQPGIEFVDGFENFFGFLNENAENLIVQKLRIRALGFFWGSRNGGFRLLFSRFNNRHVLCGSFGPGGLCADREPEGCEAVLGNSENRVVFANTLGQTFKVILDAGDGIGQNIQLFPVRNLFAAQQHVSDVALCRGQHAGNPIQRDQAEAAANAVQQARDVFNFPGIPLRGNEIHDGGLNLLQGVAGFAEQRATGFTQLT